MTITVAELDTMPPAEAALKLVSCCGSSKWVAGMLAQRPFGTRVAVLAALEAVADTLSGDDWLEAFAHHPRIGERTADAAMSPTAAGWSSGEQCAVATADTPLRSALAGANAEYEQRFGFIFIIRAADRGATEILAALRERMRNDPREEIVVAAGEQRQITHLRLEKLLAADA